MLVEKRYRYPSVVKCVAQRQSKYDIDIQARSNAAKCRQADPDWRFYSHSSDYALFYASKRSQVQSSAFKRSQV